MGLRNPHNDALTRGDYLAQPDLRPGVKESYVNAPTVAARPRWQEQAACRGVGPDAFFPERGQSVGEALAYCDRCPVVAECRAYSESLDEQMGRFGVWGGLPANQRRTSRVVDILASRGKPTTCACGKPVRYPAAGLCSRCYERQRANQRKVHDNGDLLTCRWCGFDYIAKAGGWGFCSDACRDESKAARQRMAKVIDIATVPSARTIDAAQRRHPTGRNL